MWLTGVNETGEPNNFLYKDVKISHQNIADLPENGVLIGVTRIECGDQNQKFNDNDDSEIDIDSGPVDFDENENVYNSQTEMGSFIPSNTDTKKEKNIIQETFLNESQVHNWNIGSNPINEFDVQYLASMAFPTLFPDGKGDPTNKAVHSEISDSATQSFADKLKHLIKFAEKRDEKWIYRFASNPRFAYWAYNIPYRRRILAQGNFFLKQNPSDANLPFDELKDMLISTSYESLMSKLIHYAKNISGTNAYWNRAKNDLKAIITQVGAPTIFWTLSCAEFHWPEFHNLFNDISELTDSQRRENVINNPHLLDWFFTERVEKFVKHWLKNTLGSTWHWFLYEYAVQRGSIHCHGVAKLKSDPNLCELSQTALKGFLANKSVIEGNLSSESVKQKEDEIRKGKEAENIICAYIDNLMTTENPTNPDDGSWVKPDVHPCKEHFKDAMRDPDKDYEDLVNLVQRHTKCSSAYCLYKKGENSDYSCRFNFPKDISTNTHLEYEPFKTKDGKERYKVRVVTKRNDGRLNNNQCLQLQGWRANCDIQVIIDYHSCLEYIAKYASKGETMSSVAKNAFTSVLSDPENVDANRAIKKIMMKAVGQRDMSIQEVMHQILSIKLVGSSFQVISTSLDNSRKITPAYRNTLETEATLLDLYAKRTQFESKFPGISKCNFVQFASNYYKKKQSLAKRFAPVVLKIFPKLSCNPKGPNYDLYCKYQLLKYKPWLNKVEDAWCNENPTDNVFIEQWHTFLQQTDAKTYVPDWSQQINTISEYVSQIIVDEGNVDSNVESGEREDWMYLADLKMKSDNGNCKLIKCPLDYNEDRLKYTVEEIGDMPYWIDTQKKAGTLQIPSNSEPVKIENFNNEQRVAYQIVQNQV